MARHIGILILLLMTGNVKALEIQSKVTDVTIFTERASVTRTAKLALGAGDHRVVITGFPSGLSTHDLQLEVGSRDVRIGQVSVVEQEFREATDPEYLELTRKIDKVKAKIQAVEDSSKSAQLQLKFLQSMASSDSSDVVVGTTGARSDAANWQRALNVLQTGSADAYQVIRSNDEQKAELKKDLLLLENKRANKRSVSQRNSQVVVNLTAGTAVQTTLKVVYQQWNARWRPFYEVRLDSSTGALELVQKAVIEQETEEPWLNAKVTLSTSQPNQRIDAPIVASEFIDLYDASTLYARAEVLSAAPAVSEQQLDEVVVTAARRTPSWKGEYAMNFPIAGRINVTNDADEIQRYDLETFKFESTLITLIAPRADAQAYLVARFTNNTSTPIYGSDMQVFVDGVLMGSSQMEDVLPGAEVAIPMGQDRRIEVNVKDLGGQGGDGGIIKKQRTESRDLAYEITNRRSSMASVEVRDAYPVSKNRSAKVKISSDATPPTVENEDNKKGVMLWKKQMSPGETWQIKYAYSLTYPADKQLDRSTGYGQ